MLDNVVSIITDALRALCGFLCNMLYPGIASFYELFTEIGTVVYSGGLDVIYKKISLIIGIFMIFRVTFWLIESLINPDMISDKEKNPGKIIQKVIISVVLLAITPTIFEKAFELQSAIVSNQTIEKIISVNNVSDSTATGRFLAAELFIGFYAPAETNSGTVSSDCTDIYTGRNGIHYSTLYNDGKLDLNNSCLTKKINSEDSYSSYEINFNALFATAVGAIVFWMILMYCISLGARYAQLIYLQIIAPIPIMCYLTPNKDNMFSKWLKQCTTTYLDLFIRIAIINFVMILCNMLLHNDNNSLLSTDNPAVKIFLILGLLIFAKKAPDLIQELLPKSVTKASGDFGLSLKKRADSMLGGKLMYNSLKRAPGYAAGGLAGMAVGGAMGAIGGKGIGSRIMGGISGAARGFNTGSKKGNLLKNINEVKKNQSAQNSKLQQWRINAGKGEDEPNKIGDWVARKADSTRKAMGFETKAAELKRDTDFAKQAADSYKSIIDFGSGKALEKDKSLRAFGLNRGIAELDAIQKSAATEYQSATVENLLTTEEGRLKLRNIRRKLDESSLNNEKNRKIEEFKANGLSDEDAERKAEEYIDQKIKDEFESKTDSEKVKAAEEAIEYLRTKSINATQLFEDKKKQAGFIHLVEEYAAGKDQNIINEFKVMNDFLASHPDIAEKFGIESFDAEKMSNLLQKAQSGDQNAQQDFKNIFDSFDKFKTLKSIYVAKNAEKEALRDKANDQFNGK